MSTDRELLELAARAAGIKVESWVFESDDPKFQGAWLNDDEFSGEGWWNPLTDDGDALRLAVKLDMDIFIRRCSMWSGVVAPMVPAIEEDHGGDPYAATRRAIVRAAAAIGRGMP